MQDGNDLLNVQHLTFPMQLPQPLLSTQFDLFKVTQQYCKLLRLHETHARSDESAIIASLYTLDSSQSSNLDQY